MKYIYGSFFFPQRWQLCNNALVLWLLPSSHLICPVMTWSRKLAPSFIIMLYLFLPLVISLGMSGIQPPLSSTSLWKPDLMLPPFGSHDSSSNIQPPAAPLSDSLYSLVSTNSDFSYQWLHLISYPSHPLVKHPHEWYMFTLRREHSLALISSASCLRASTDFSSLLYQVGITSAK